MRAFIAVIILVPMLFGCATTKSTISKRYIASSQSKLSITISKSPEVLIPEEQYQLIESQIRDGLAKSDLLSGGDVSPQHSVVVKLQSFRMRPDAARLTVGIMAGCDKINSEVVVTNIQTQEEIGKSNVSITECAAWGVASQVIKKYTDGVVAYLSNKNR